MSNITIIGTGYVGLVSGACLADFGNTVTCIDTNTEKIADLKAGRIPIYEPGLEDVVVRNVAAGRLQFHDRLAERMGDAEVLFIAVGTPPAEDGSADLVYVEQVAREIGKNLKDYKVIVDKSTVPVGTGQKVKGWIEDELAKRKVQLEFDVVSNPEFLREGAAVQDFMHPDRIVIGSESERAANVMKDVYRSLYLNQTPFLETGIETAEMIKYASNAFLAVKITFINEIANLCEKVGANVQDVAAAMGRDGRISNKFLHPGPGYGGSCFPKDTLALAKTGRDYDTQLSVIDATILANENQKRRMVKKVERAFENLGGVQGKTIAILGLSFKPNTDDMREAPSITVIEGLVKGGANIKAFDPAAMEEARWRLKEYKENISYCSNEYEAIEGSDALVIMTEWNQFRNLDMTRIKNGLAHPLIFDMRNIYRRAEMEEMGFTYHGVGI